MRRKYFINNVFKLDSQRSAVLVANFSSVIKVVLLSAVVRCSPLNTALCVLKNLEETCQIIIKNQILGMW